MQPTDTTAAERIQADRARYVAPGMATPRLVVAHAEGARVTDPDGRTYIDFAGGIGCQNTGHRHAAIVDAIKEQADRYLHQCFMIGTYEPYVEVCRRLAELSPCGGGEQRSILVNSGAEAVENAVKIARWATGRQAVVAFDNAFHGRTLLAMTMTSKVKPYKAGFGPFAPEVYRAPGAVPVPRHLVRRLDRRARAPLQGRRRPVDGRLSSCSSRCRARAGSSRCRRTIRRSSRSSAGATGSCG